MMSYNAMFRTIDLHRVELGFGIGSTIPIQVEDDLYIRRTPEELMQLLLDYYNLNKELLKEMMFDIINKHPELLELEWKFLSELGSPW